MSVRVRGYLLHETVLLLCMAPPGRDCGGGWTAGKRLGSQAKKHIWLKLELIFKSADALSSVVFRGVLSLEPQNGGK